MMTPHADTSALFVFPGIGVEHCGHEKSLYSRFAPLYKPFFDEASESALRNIGEALLADEIGSFDERQVQLYHYAFGAGTAAVCVDNGLTPNCTAGYSFGVYNALHAAGVLTFTDGREVLEKAYELMAECSACGRFGMCAVIGLPLDELSGVVVKESLDGVYHSNSNNEFCHIFGGDRLQILRMNRAALDAEAISAVELPVTLPYHHPGFARRVTGPFTEFCDRFLWREPALPFYSTIAFRPLPTAESVKDFVVRHLTAPINWYATVVELYARSCALAVECGPGISLTQNARFIPGAVKWINCKNLESRLRR